MSRTWTTVKTWRPSFSWWATSARATAPRSPTPRSRSAWAKSSGAWKSLKTKSSSASKKTRNTQSRCTPRSKSTQIRSLRPRPPSTSSRAARYSEDRAQPASRNGLSLADRRNEGNVHSSRGDKVSKQLKWRDVLSEVWSAVKDEWSTHSSWEGSQSLAIVGHEATRSQHYSEIAISCARVAR